MFPIVEGPKRHIPWRAIAISVGSGALLAGAFAGTLALYRSDLLRVRHIEVVGVQVVDAQVAANAAEIARESLLHLDTDAAAERVARLPGVVDVRVHRDWPQGVVIDVDERQGWGYWQVLNHRAVIDAEGLVVDKARPPAADAPTIQEIGSAQPLEPGAHVDRDTVELVTRLRSDGTFEQLGLQPQRFEFERTRGLVVRFNNAPAVVFGDSHDYEFKVAAWGATTARIKADRMKVNEIDLRFGKELVVR
jgi:cell division protein FtsQ